MQIAARPATGGTILDITGDIDLAHSPAMRKALLQEIREKKTPKVFLNLEKVRYIDSSGIGELVSAFTTVRNQGGELKLLNLTKKVHDLLQITKLYTVFDVRDEEATAVKAFS